MNDESEGYYLCSSLLMLNEQSFSNRKFERAYQFLVSALYCAVAHDSELYCLKIEQIAIAQLAVINALQPIHRMSSTATAARGRTNVYAQLVKNARLFALIAKARAGQVTR